MASHLGKTLCQYMAEVTEREHRGWLAWLESQWNRPDRHDYYLMRLAAMWGNSKDLSKYKITFGTNRPTTATLPDGNDGKPTVQSHKQWTTATAKLKWFNSMTLPIRGLEDKGDSNTGEPVGG